ALVADACTVCFGSGPRIPAGIRAKVALVLRRCPVAVLEPHAIGDLACGLEAALELERAVDIRWHGRALVLLHPIRYPALGGLRIRGGTHRAHQFIHAGVGAWVFGKAGKAFDE